MIDIDLPTLHQSVGREVAVSDWMDISQDRIRQFADATEDHQWIHIDAARAEMESPFKTTIAHGFLTLSLVSVLARTAMRFGRLRMAINYGVNRVRFVSAVPAGSRIRGRFAVANVERGEGYIQVSWQATIEREGGDKPACVAEWVVRYYPAAP